MASTSHDIDLTWVQCDGDDSIWTDFGDGYVVYHRPSGKTHLMNDSSARLVRDLLKQPLGLHDVAVQFEAPDADPQNEEYLERLLSMLLRLEQFGLIERT